MDEDLKGMVEKMKENARRREKVGRVALWGILALWALTLMWILGDWIRRG